MGRKIRYYRNETTDPRLVRGKLYTMHELARRVKQSPTTIRSRVGTGDTVTDEHFISKKVTRSIWPVFENEIQEKSSQWLRRKL
jgi:hypothetical protein